MIATSSISQENLRSLSRQDSSYQNFINSPLTPYDTLPVSVKYRYIVATRMLYREWVGYKKIENQQLYTIQSQDRQIQSLLKSNKFLTSADSVNKIIIKNDSILYRDLSLKYKDSETNLRRNKWGKIGAGISIPVVAILSFLLGFYITK